MVKYAERAPGVYRAKFVKLDPAFELTDRETGETVVRWRWVFQSVTDSTTIGEMDTVTSPGFKARSNGLKFFTGMLGRPPTETDDTDDYLGQEFDVVWGPNQNGRNTITNVLRVIDGPAEAPRGETGVRTMAEVPATAPQPLP
jgi:hypothetical protein